MLSTEKLRMFVFPFDAGSSIRCFPSHRVREFFLDRLKNGQEWSPNGALEVGLAFHVIYNFIPSAAPIAKRGKKGL